MVIGHISPTFAFDRDSAFGISQKAIGLRLDNYQFQSTDGRTVRIDDYKGKPLVISLIYTSCYHICPTTTKHLQEVVNKARKALGEDSFNVLTIGFDVFRDTPIMMEKFRNQQNVNDEYWQFLSSDTATIDHLSKQLGFLYETSPHGFDHLIQATVLDAESTIVQQVYGMQFETPILIEPLKRLVFGNNAESDIITTLSDKIRLFCTVYDPGMDRYRLDYSLFIGMFIGFMSVFILGFNLIREWRKTLRSS